MATEGIDLLPADGEAALRELSEEELQQTGAYGSLAHLMVARYSPETFEAAVGLLPASVLHVADRFGQTLLHAMAACGGSVAALQRVLQIVGDEALATPDDRGRLPLHVAVLVEQASPDAERSMALEMLKKMPRGALAHRTAEGENLLHALARGLDSAVVMEEFIAVLPEESLLAKDVYGRTPLHTAAEAGWESILPLLQASPAEVLAMEDSKGMCPLELALRRRPPGSAFSATSTCTLPAFIDAYVRNGVLEQKITWRVISPLHIAIARHVDLVSAVAASPQAKGWALIPDPVTGVLPIHRCCSSSNSIFTARAFSPVLDLMRPEDMSRPIEGSSVTALQLAVSNKSFTAALKLLDTAGHTFNVDAHDDRGRSLLAQALLAPIPREEQSSELLRRILDLSVSPCPLTVTDWRKMRQFVDASLLVAVCSCYEENFFDSTSPGDWEGGSTPLHCACYRLHLDNSFESGDDAEAYREDLLALLQLLPQWFVTVRDGMGFTPLHCATVKGNAIAVDLLLDLPDAARAAEMALAAPPLSIDAGIPLEAAVKAADIHLVRLFVAKVPHCRSLQSMQGNTTLSELVDGLHDADPRRYDEVKAAFVPPVKSAAD